MWERLDHLLRGVILISGFFIVVIIIFAIINDNNNEPTTEIIWLGGLFLGSTVIRWVGFEKFLER